MSGKTAKKMTKAEYFEKERTLIGSSTVDFDGPVLTGGKGVIAYDLGGKDFLDFTGQISLLNTGYAPKEVVSALCQQVKSGVHSCISADYPYLNEITINRKKVEVSRAALVERLIAITDKVMPFKKRAYFEVSGATAVNSALKIAKIAALRKRGIKTEDFQSMFDADILIPSQNDLCKFSFLVFRNAFHGRHGDVQCLTNSKAKQLWAASSSCAFGRLPFPLPGKKCDFEVVGKMIVELEKYAPVVAFIFEPVQGEGGIRVPDSQNLRKLIGSLKALSGGQIAIIADEVQTGLGRTGKMWACEHFDIHPDMLVTSKSLGAGIPIGAVIVNADKFPDLEPGMHSGSHHATPLAVAAAIVNIDKIVKENLVERSLCYGEYAIRRLKEIAKEHIIISDVRGLGLMIGIEFQDANIRDAIEKNCKDNGLLLAHCGEKAIRMTPPLIVSIDEIDKAIEIFEKSLPVLNFKLPGSGTISNS